MYYRCPARDVDRYDSEVVENATTSVYSSELRQGVACLRRRQEKLKECEMAITMFSKYGLPRGYRSVDFLVVQDQSTENTLTVSEVQNTRLR
jgi:hypothetical protein